MIRNSFPGKCPCSAFVPKGQGYVIRRKIRCEDCAEKMAEGEGLEEQFREEERGRFGDSDRDDDYGF